MSLKLFRRSIFFSFRYSRYQNFSAQTKSLSDSDLLDIFNPSGQPPLYDKNFIPERKINKPSKKHLKEVNAIISCKRPELNHYRNQKYDKFVPVPLASKGWHHRKSKQDHFTIKISDKDEYVEDLFWNSDYDSFENLKLSNEVVQALDNIDIKQPTHIQVEAIPKLLKGKNCLITAETGCGKTIAFLLPAIEQVLKWNSKEMSRSFNKPHVLILTPSRELTQQIGRVAKSLTQSLPISCKIITGGKTKQKILNPDFENVDIIIATIGAMSKFTTSGIYDVSEVKHLILDEADSLLDDSFNELLLHYLKKFKIQYLPEYKDGIPKHTQLTLVSATSPTSLYDILSEFVEPDALTKISTGRLHKILPHVPQTFYRLRIGDKPSKLLELTKAACQRNQPMVIFSNKSKTCDWISLMLNENGVKATQLNGEMPYILRKGVFDDFQKGFINILSCTDIASRGLDTTRAQHILNYDFPMYMADYIHRCGRTGRVGSPSNCIISNFVSGRREVELVQKIELAVRLMEELPNVNANITKIINYKIQKSLKST